MWSYNPTNLDKETPEGRKNIVRFLIGDTDEGDPQLQDEEILFTLSSNDDKLYNAAISCVSALISKFSRLVNTELDEAIRSDFSDLVGNYVALRKELVSKTKLTNNSITIIATGLTSTDFDKATADPSRLKPGIEQYKWRDYDISDNRYRNASGETWQVN